MSSVTPAAALEPIPRDPGWPIVGNLFQITPGEIGQHLLARSRHHDGIFELDFAGRRVPSVSSVALAAEVCDPGRFRKIIGPPLSYLRDMAGDRLFTAHSDEPNWGCAHRILMPAFSQRAMKRYFDVMLRVANRLVDNWAQKGPDADIAVADDMTRLTLDTIALSGFGYNFESFASAQLDPFIVAMVGALEMVYMCGDGRRMAPAVRQALIEIGTEQGGMTPEAASDWFAGLVAQGRYRQDVFN